MNEKELLDHFAGLAMQGFLANPGEERSPEELAGIASDFAQALFEERKKRDEATPSKYEKEGLTTL